MRIDRVVAALLLVQLLFAIHYVGTKWLMEFIPARAWVALRVGGAAVVLLLLARPWWRRFRLARPWVGRLLALSLFGVCLNQILFLEGLSRTVPSHSALINTSIPVTTLLVAVLLRQERLTPRKAFAVALSLAGVLLLLGIEDVDLAEGSRTGDLMCLANATSFSVFLVLARPVMRELSPFVVTPLIFLAGSLGVGLYGSPSLAGLDWGSIPEAAWWMAAAMILGPTVGAYFLNQWALSRVESSMVALYVYLQFLLAAPLSALFLGERLSWRLLPAALLVFAGVALSSLRRHEKRGGPAGRPHPAKSGAP